METINRIFILLCIALLLLAIVWGIYNKSKKLDKKIYFGFHIIYFAIVIGFLWNFTRIVYLQYFVPQTRFLDKAANFDTIFPNRGTIYCLDKNGEQVVLSANLPVYQIYFDGKQADNIMEYIQGKTNTKNINNIFCMSDSIKKLSNQLADYLQNGKAAEYEQMFLDAYKNKIYTKKIANVNLIQLDSISKFPLFSGRAINKEYGLKTKYGSCLYKTERQNRISPYGDLAKKTIGDVYGDVRKKTAGKNGIELYFDSILKGKPGLVQKLKISQSKMVDYPIEPKQDGADIVLTLDMDLQEIVTQALRQQAKTLGVERACAILMEVETGKIKAMVNLEKENYTEEDMAIDNMAINSNNELGSVFKVPTIMVALENNLVTDSTNVCVSHPNYNIQVKDVHHFGSDSLTVTQVVVQSSNVGTVNIMYGYYNDKQEEYYREISKLKFDAPINFDIPAANPEIKTKTSDFYKKFYGYIKVSPLYMLRFYNAIANNGKMINPFIITDKIEDKKSLKGFPKEKGEVVTDAICSTKTLESVKKMLIEVVKKNYKTNIVTFAGKTGTADITASNASQGTFCGYFPVEKPKYSCIVVMYRKGAANLFGVESGQVFKNIAEEITILEGNNGN